MALIKRYSRRDVGAVTGFLTGAIIGAIQIGLDPQEQSEDAVFLIIHIFLIVFVAVISGLFTGWIGLGIANIIIKIYNKASNAFIGSFVSAVIGTVSGFLISTGNVGIAYFGSTDKALPILIISGAIAGAFFGDFVVMQLKRRGLLYD